MSSRQQSLGEFDEVPTTPFERRWGITREELEARASRHGLDADGDRERFCEECGNRVTELSNDKEAGHQKRADKKGGRCSQLVDHWGDA